MSRAELEYAVLVDQVRRRKEALVTRLSRWVKHEGECVLWTGTQGSRNGGYGKVNFKYEGRHVQIDVHRLFLIARLCRPIADGMEAGHYQCFNRLCVDHVREETRQQNLWARDERKEKRSN